MKRLLTLGCSLSDFPDGGWPYTVGEYFDKHDHFAFGGGGNQQLLDIIDEYLIYNKVKDLTIVYQLTGMTRAGGLYMEEYNNEWLVQEPTVENKYSMKWQGYFGDQNMYWSDNYKVVKESIRNPIKMSTRTIAKLCLLSDAGANVYTFRGWTGVMSQHTFDGKSQFTAEEHWQKAKVLLDKHKVKYVDIPIVDWCILNDKELPDGFHPSGEASKDFANKMLIPLIKEN